MDCKAVSPAWASCSWKKMQKSFTLVDSHWFIQANMIESIDIKTFSWKLASLRSYFSNSLISHSWKAVRSQSSRSSFCWPWQSCEWYLFTKNGRWLLRMFHFIWDTLVIFSIGFGCFSASHCKLCERLGKPELSSLPFPTGIALEQSLLVLEWSLMVFWLQ